MSFYSVNEAAAEIIEKEVIPFADRLNIIVSVLENGATVLDMGIHAKGGFRAGKYFAEIGMGGLGRLNYMMMKAGGHLLPALQCVTEDPAVCEMASYVARTKVPWKGGVQVVSGPVRSILGSDDFARSVDYRDPSPRKAVCGVQCETLPDEELADGIGKTCGIAPEDLYIMAARTGCMVGAVQVSARNVEQSLPTVFDRGFSMDRILEGNAVSPVICVCDDEDTAYGRVNDCLIYGQETNLTVRCEDADIEGMLEDIPFSKNTDVYGTPFEPLFARCGRSWANVPRDWDAPCRINFYNVKTGKVFSTGSVHEGVLVKGFLGEGGRIA